MKDFYGTLGVEKTVNTSELKKAYRKLAMKYHPDKNDGDKVAGEMFRKVNEAYDVLSDEEKRKIYDEQLANPSRGKGNQQGFRGQQQQRAKAAGSQKFDFESMNESFKNGGFENMFGFNGKGQKVNKEKDNAGKEFNDNVNNMFGNFFGKGFKK